MNEIVLKTQGLTKKYGDMYALNRISLTLQPGRIYGLIGQNGAGKTTFMRLIAGLGFPTEGSIELFGCDTPDELRKARKRIGFIIETAALYPSLSAKDNIALMRTIRGIPNAEFDDELLKLVGLGDTKRRSVRHFSLGMKQRLGIAMALTGYPDFLILDEPINGLDPVGVVDVRELLKRLCVERNITILLSSHNLPELYQVATDYIIIDQGEIKAKITQEQLDERCRRYILIRCGDPERAAALIADAYGTLAYSVMPDQSIRLYDGLNEVSRVAELLQSHGILTTNFSVEGDTLESYYLSMIGGEIR